MTTALEWARSNLGAVEKTPKDLHYLSRNDARREWMHQHKARVKALYQAMRTWDLAVAVKNEAQGVRNIRESLRNHFSGKAPLDRTSLYSLEKSLQSRKASLSLGRKELARRQGYLVEDDE